MYGIPDPGVLVNSTQQGPSERALLWGPLEHSTRSAVGCLRDAYHPSKLATSEGCSLRAKCMDFAT
jgi:hypothetical protein